MPTLLFRDLDSVRKAIVDGIVPTAVHQGSVTQFSTNDNSVRLMPHVALSRNALFGLARKGVRMFRDPPQHAGVILECWHRLFPLVPEPSIDRDPPTSALLALPADRVAEFIGELLRLGGKLVAGSWSSQLETDDSSPSRSFLLVRQLPFSLLSRVIEQPNNFNASLYIESFPGLWVVAGHRHPLGESVPIIAGKWRALTAPDHWEAISETGMASLATAFPIMKCENIGVESQVTPVDTKPIPRLESSLRLVPSRDRESPTFWVAATNVLATLSELAKSLDERRFASFSFAVFRTEGVVTLLLRSNNHAAFLPILLPEAVAYRPNSKLPNLFVPAGYGLQPTFRRDVMRRLLAPDPHRLTWLQPDAAGGFQIQTIPIAGFRPLRDWIHYRNDNSIRAHAAWEPAIDWSFEQFTLLPSADGDPIDRVLPQNSNILPTDTRAESLGAKSGFISRVFSWLKGSPPSQMVPNPEQSHEDADTVSLDFPSELMPEPPVRITEIRQRCEQLESRFLKALPTLTVEAMREDWPELATTYAQLNNRADASICWINALWEQASSSTLWAWGWLRAEAHQARWKLNETDLAQFLAMPPATERTRAVAAFLVWVSLQEKPPQALTPLLGELQKYLDTNESHLPIRAAWLARICLSKMCGGDVLGLARSRDRLLDRLRNGGLDQNIDMPAFLPFNEAGAADRFQLVRKWLLEKRSLIHRWIDSMTADPDLPTLSPPASEYLRTFGLNAESTCTRAYADLLLAWGLARLRHGEDASTRKDAALQQLDLKNPVHSALADAFAFRIRQARDGKQDCDDLPTDWHEKVASLTTLERYAVERLCAGCGVLDTRGQSDAYWTSTFRHTDSNRADSFNDVMQHSSEIKRLDELLANPDEMDEGHLRIIHSFLSRDASLDSILLDRLTVGLPVVLDRIAGKLSIQVPLLEKSFLIAGEFDRPLLAQALWTRFARLLDEVETPAAILGIASFVKEVVRCYRRLGSRTEMQRVLLLITQTVMRGGDFSQLRKHGNPTLLAQLETGCHLAKGWYFCGAEDRAHGIVDEIRKDLYGSALTPQERTSLGLVYAETLGELSFRLALVRFEELFQRLRSIRVQGTTNAYFTLQPLMFIDRVVRAVVQQHFVMDPTVRNWLVEDEHRVRQRIQHDFETMLQVTTAPAPR